MGEGEKSMLNKGYQQGFRLPEWMNSNPCGHFCSSAHDLNPKREHATAKLESHPFLGRVCHSRQSVTGEKAKSKKSYSINVSFVCVKSEDS